MLYVVRIKGTRHLATIHHAYPDGFSVVVPCLKRRYGTLWAESYQMEQYDGEPCCWRCEKKKGIGRYAEAAS